MPTIKDIAKAAGVSHSTVSNVLNKKPGVSSEKIRLVQETARALGYRIDEQASLLRKGVTRTVAVILPDIRNARYCDLYSGILRSLEERGYSARLFLTDNVLYLEQRAIDGAIAAKACAILTVTCLPDAGSRYFVPSLAQTPVLFMERKPGQSEAPCFCFDFFKAGVELAKRAADSGHPSPKVFTGSTYYSPNHDFLEGVRSVFTDLPPEACVEMSYGKCSTDAYLPFTGSDPCGSFITSGAEIADQLYNASHTVGASKEPQIFTLAPLRAVQDSRYCTLALNYSRLGEAAAEAILDTVESSGSLASRVLSPSCCQPFEKSPAVLSEKTLRVLFLSSPTAQALSCLLPNFTRQTGINVELETFPLNTIYSHILSGQELNWDVIRLDVSCFDSMAPTILEPLNRLDPDAKRHLDRFLPGLEDNYAYVDGTLYAFPFDISTQMLFYRRDLFEDAMQMRSYFEATKHHLRVPETFEEYNEVARFFTRSFRPESPTDYGTSIALGTASSTASEYLVRLLGMGADSYDEDGRLHLSSPKAKKVLQNYLEAAAYADPEVIHSWTAATDAFVCGKTAMTILFANHASGIIRAQNALFANQVGFAPVPGSRPLLGGGVLGVSAHSVQKEEAYRFICWATGDEIASRLMIMGGISSCRLAYEQAEILGAYPWLRDFEKNLRAGSRKTILTTGGSHLDIHRFEVELGQLIIDAAAKKRPLDETLWRAQLVVETLQAGGNDSLRDRRG